MGGNGRFINAADMREQRKVVVINENTAKNLFLNGESALGKYVQINKILFQVVGIYTDMG